MRFNPVSTYRIQFHKGFNFNNLKDILPYLKKLGVRTIYASPVFESTPGSTHGYDVINPHRIDPEIGTIDQFREIANQLKELGISWIQDIVPNHMAFDHRNSWLFDVLKNGRQSKFSNFFDISWSAGDGRLMVPFLGASFDEVADNGEITIKKEGDILVFKYYDSLYPLNQQSSETIEQDGLEQVNGSPNKLKEIHQQQHYRLCHWQETNTTINFRRFFTINGLISLNMHDPEVFEEYHKFIKQLLDEKLIQGLRVDHVDGMYDPAEYLSNLRSLAGEDTYIVIEKILEFEEELPSEWPIDGSTGYGFLALTNNLVSNRSSKSRLTEFYHTLTSDKRSVEERTREKKKNILYNRLAGDLDNLYQLLQELDLVDSKFRNENLKNVIAQFLIECPVYRYYGNSMPLNKEELIEIQHIFITINERNPDLEQEAEALEKALLHDPLSKDEDFRKRAAHFYRRIMQYTGPVMAKGVEDTLMYTYSRFIGHNEVGDNPSFLGIPIGEFHQKMVERQRNWPLALNATSTHDTKRGEDVRMRLNVLTDIPDDWLEHVRKWRDYNKNQKTDNLPDANDEYFLYQTIVGAFPMPGQDKDNFPERLKEYITKALREAKRHTNWTEPDEHYEKSTIKFAAKLLDEETEFWKSFTSFHSKVADFGIINSLSQLVLKYTCPGVPDLYQGCEFWDLSLVDPDNRRPVNYKNRMKYLNEEKLPDDNFVSHLWNERYNGKIKFWLTELLLKLRTSHQDLFLNGGYTPLQVKGRYKDHIIAYMRKYVEEQVIVILPKGLAAISKEQNTPIEEIEWKDTHVNLPYDEPATLHNIITGTATMYSSEIIIKDIFAHLPISILKHDE